MSILSLSYYESDVRITNVMQSLPTKWRKNSWHRYDMKKLRHCHPMYKNIVNVYYIYAVHSYWAVLCIYSMTNCCTIVQPAF